MTYADNEEAKPVEKGKTKASTWELRCWAVDGEEYWRVDVHFKDGREFSERFHEPARNLPSDVMHSSERRARGRLAQHIANPDGAL